MPKAIGAFTPVRCRRVETSAIPSGRTPAWNQIGAGALIVERSEWRQEDSETPLYDSRELTGLADLA